MKIDSGRPRIVTRILYTAGILVSLATFILHAIPVNRGIFLVAACFIIGSMFWSGRCVADTRSERS